MAGKSVLATLPFLSDPLRGSRLPHRTGRLSRTLLWLGAVAGEHHGRCHLSVVAGEVSPAGIRSRAVCPSAADPRTGRQARLPVDGIVARATLLHRAG